MIKAAPLAGDRRAGLRRRLTLVTVAYLGGALVFGALTDFGVTALAEDVAGFGAPWMVAGVFASMGCLAIAVAAWSIRGAVLGDRNDPRLSRAAALARYGRLAILLGAVGALIAAALTLPVGDDELSFVLSVNGGLVLALALFALVADDVHRVVRQVRPPA